MSDCPVCMGIEGYNIHMCGRGRGDEMSQCTCATDKQITCIVHPTESSLKARIAELEKVAIHAQFYLSGLPDADGYELGEALRAAGYLGEGE